jgi:hypothetical protein
MLTRDDFQKAIDLIDKSSNVLITTHIRPDGDGKSPNGMNFSLPKAPQSLAKPFNSSS